MVILFLPGDPVEPSMSLVSSKTPQKTPIRDVDAGASRNFLTIRVSLSLWRVMLTFLSRGNAFSCAPAVISARKAQLLSAKARNDQLYSTLAVRVSSGDAAILLKKPCGLKPVCLNILHATTLAWVPKAGAAAVGDQNTSCNSRAQCRERG